MRPQSTIRRFFGGMGYLGRGLGMWASSPRAMMFGAIPPLIVGAVYVGLGILFFINLGGIVEWATPFAAGSDWREFIRTGVSLALGAAAIVIGVFTFTAVTLTVGDPFYERISRIVEETLGNAPDELDESFWKGLWRGIAGGIRFLALTASVGLVLFIAGFIPFIGQTVVPVIGAFVAGWFLAIELSEFAFELRGLKLKDRRRMLGRSRATTVGFGLLTYLLFLIPLGSVLVMPAAVAGATMLARDSMAEPSR